MLSPVFDPPRSFAHRILRGNVQASHPDDLNKGYFLALLDTLNKESLREDTHEYGL